MRSTVSTHYPPAVLADLGASDTSALEQRCREYLSALRWPAGLACSYKTARFTGHRIRAAMQGRGEELLRGVVEAEASHDAVAPRSRRTTLVLPA
jgi:hypothetical protein